MSDPRTCVLHPNTDAVECCVLTGVNANHGVLRDWCAECIDSGEDDHNFGRCYNCADGLHLECIGVPCQCDCPIVSLAQIVEREIGVELASRRRDDQRRGGSMTTL